jgi:hypothetical protein
MAAKLILHYDREGDILYIDTVQPYPEQPSEGLGNDVIAPKNPYQVKQVRRILFRYELGGRHGE